jgi:hypothetical protein
MSASKNAARYLKGQKSQRNGAKNGVMAKDFTQKSLVQTIRPCTSPDDELFRPSLKADCGHTKAGLEGLQ